MIKVSDTARDKVIQLMTDDGFNAKTDFVRVGVKSGGCSVIVDKKSFLYLVGTTLEFSGGLNGKGFVFNNPNANRTCGCGESFSL